MADITSDADDVTVRTLAAIHGLSPAEVRRRLLAGACAEARQDPAVAEIVTLILAARREAAADTVVVPMRRRR